MTGVEVTSIVGVIVVGVGLIATWVRNGRSSARNLGSLETGLKNMERKLDDENTGLGAIKKSVDDQRVHCAKITSAYGERIKSLEKRD